MDRHSYIQVLRDNMLPWTSGLQTELVFVQDSTPPHVARDMVAFLDQHDVEVMDWPAEHTRICLRSKVNLDPIHVSSSFQSG